MSKTRGVVVIMAKRPALGKVKTRLAASVGDEMALELYQQMLSKTFHTVLNLGKKVVVMATGEGNMTVPPSFIQQEQIQADLGAKMMHGFQSAQALCPGEPAVMVGTDCFDLSASELAEAFDVLTSHQLVFGPSEDGGYYLIGMNTPQSDVFEDIEWSTPSVMEETRKRMRSSNLSWGEVKTLNDIDTLEDLKLSSLWTDVKSKI